ncbi:hypothetical protein OKW46_000354 [Paraburkholderia sp. WSM4179]|nr:hypothetical protein [Paraburkholderia sp. WSM4179]
MPSAWLQPESLRATMKSADSHLIPPTSLRPGRCESGAAAATGLHSTECCHVQAQQGVRCIRLLNCRPVGLYIDNDRQHGVRLRLFDQQTLSVQFAPHPPDWRLCCSRARLGDCGPGFKRLLDDRSSPLQWMPSVLAPDGQLDCLRHRVHSPLFVDTVGHSCPSQPMIASSRHGGGTVQIGCLPYNGHPRLHNRGHVRGVFRPSVPGPRRLDSAVSGIKANCQGSLVMARVTRSSVVAVAR